jgi:trimeric autotransporter adhesin
VKKLILFLYLCSNAVYGQTITTIAGTGNSGYSGDGGAATLAELKSATGVATDTKGNVYFLDYGNHVVRKIDRSGIITTIAGKKIEPGVSPFEQSKDSSSATDVVLRNVSSIAVDKKGVIYLGDTYNSVVRTISPLGTIKTFAGTYGALGDGGGDGGLATEAYLGGGMGGVGGVAIDDTGNVIIADAGSCKIRKVNTAGLISTIAGTGVCGYSGDGGSVTAAKIDHPQGVALDKLGNIYFADALNYRIRKINSSGTISTIAGDGTGGYSGDGKNATEAQINMPGGIATDYAGNVYITDNNRIRKISPAGIITTIAGGASTESEGDGGAATAAGFYSTSGLAIDTAGNIYIADHTRVRKISTPDASRIKK